jgi:hypothetical protein
MELKRTVLVHRITIARAALSDQSHINMAVCRLCKLVIKRNEQAAVNKDHLLVAVRSDWNQILKYWIVPEPLHAEMKMCSSVE